MPRLPPAPMISTVSPGFELGDVEQQVPGGRHVAHHHGGVVEVEAVGQRDRRAGRHATSSAKPPGRLMPIMPSGPA